jgi:parvulin-like peptidyl-prolyl isomerase
LAKKKNVEKPQRQITKRQLSSIKRQKRRQNFIFYGGILIIAVVIVIVFVGLYMGEIRPYHQTVFKVYDREFNAQYLMDAVKYFGRLYPPETYLTNLANLVYSSPNFIAQSELISRGAADLGITVDDDEVKESLKENEVAVNDASIDLARLSFLNDRLIEEYFKPRVTATADQVNLKAMFLESESQAFAITAELAASDNFTGLAGEYSLDSYTKYEKGDLGWHSREFLEYELGTTVPVEYAFDAEIGTLSQPIYDEKSKSVGYWMVNILERQEDNQAYVEVILLGSVEEADVVIQRLIDGEDFGELAREFSQDDSREQGGDLGWVTPGFKSAVFDEYVFNPEALDLGVQGPIEDTSVSTKGGYWLVQVVDREENRPREEEEIGSLADQAFDDWVSQLWEEATDEIDQSLLTAEVAQWIVEKLMEE